MTLTTYAADHTALLIVDPYNDFMSEGGKLYEAAKETAEAVGFYENMRTLIPAIRAARIHVVIVPHHRWQASDYQGWKHMNPSQVRANQAQGFAAGSWGGEFHPEFGPHPGDAVVLEHWGQSGFANTDLDVQLTQRGIENIILVGDDEKGRGRSEARTLAKNSEHMTTKETSMGKLEEKIALITGGNSGIGLATAKQFVHEGAYVFITGRREPELAAAVKEIGSNVTGVQGDVSNLCDLDRLFAQIQRE